MAAVAGAPLRMRVRYRGTTPQEQMGKGRPMAIPRIAWFHCRPRRIQEMEDRVRNELMKPATR